jgi:hypothetical protein
MKRCPWAFTRDEALPLGVHQDPALQAPGLRRRQRDRRGVHVQRRRAGRDAEAYPAAVVALGADPDLAPPEQWRVRLEHRLVVDEAAGREDHAAAGANRAFLPEGLGDDAAHAAVRPLDQGDTAVVHSDPGGTRLDGGDELLHQERTGLVLHARHVTARRGHRALAERMRALGAGPDESVVGRRLSAGAVIEDGLEGNALVHEPFVMCDGTGAVEP